VEAAAAPSRLPVVGNFGGHFSATCKRKTDREVITIFGQV